MSKTTITGGYKGYKNVHHGYYLDWLLHKKNLFCSFDATLACDDDDQKPNLLINKKCLKKGIFFKLKKDTMLS